MNLPVHVYIIQHQYRTRGGDWRTIHTRVREFSSLDLEAYIENAKQDDRFVPGLAGSIVDPTASMRLRVRAMQTVTDSFESL